MTRNITETDALKRLAFAQPIWRLTLGEAFSTGEYFADVAAGNAKEVVVNNPTEDTYYGIYGVNIRVSAEGEITKAFNVTEDTEGDAPTTGITNKKSGVDGTTATAHIGGDGETGVYSGGNLFNDKGVGSGSGDGGGAAPGDTAEGGFDNVVEPGDNLMIRVTNTSGGQINYISIDIDWGEIPDNEYPA